VRGQPIPIRPRRNVTVSTGLVNGREELVQQLASRLVGQAHAIAEIVPYVQMFRAGLGPEGRPAGVFLLLGPTGTGKTRTVEALADALHGSEKNLLRVDCGEFQMEHEIAKLIGAPPGYLGHRETPPMLTQQKLGAVTSEASPLALVLFDEIEKAAPSMTRLLLGVLDKAVLRLGDNTSVNFERTLIFLTSNLGAAAMRKELLPDFGFAAGAAGAGDGSLRKLSGIGLSAVKRRFAPEFVNRIDAMITYQPLDAHALEAILDQQIAALEKHIADRLEDRAFGLEVDPSARDFLLAKGTSPEFGARELKRIILRKLTQPLAAMVEAGQIAPESVVLASHPKGAEQLLLGVVDN
jgi:ATP-dependent Clp protease ATP-binding subunit ClpA